MLPGLTVRRSSRWLAGSARAALLAVALTVVLATPARADPITAAIGALVSGIQAFAASSAIAGFIVRTAFSVGLSLLSRALQGKPRAGGIRTDVTSTGGTAPERFILGRHATAGHLAAPPRSYGSNNSHLVYVVVLGTMPGQAINRVILNGAYVTLGATVTQGREVGGKYAGRAWVKELTGTQTAADSYLLSNLGSSPRAWTSDMIGRGLHLAICTFRFNPEVFRGGLPSVDFEVLGIPLYDPRKDSTVGGSGAHRWANTATWERTENPVVMIYNIMRGITLPSGDVWGGLAAGADLPLASWFAAMNACDVSVTLAAGGSEATYRAGLEASVDEEPADVIERLLASCSGQMAEAGGVWRIAVGPPALPVMFITDDDLIDEAGDLYEPFPALSETWNGVQASYVEPSALWEAKDAAPWISTSFITEDQGRRLIASLSLPAVFSRRQAQQLSKAYVKDQRRFARHSIALPPDAARLEVLDTISWTSARNGYVGKTFEVTSITDDPMGAQVGIALRERDPSDYDWSTVDESDAPVPDTTEETPGTITATGLALTAIRVKDSGGTDRRPAIRVTWTAPGVDDITGMRWQLRPTGQTDAITGEWTDLDALSGVLTQAIVAERAYEVRIRPRAPGRATAWSAWAGVTTLAQRFVRDDLETGAVSDILEAYAPASIPAPASGANLFNQSLGATERGEIWLRAVVFEARAPGTSSITLELQQRRAELGGVLSDWNTLDTFLVDQPAWEVYADTGTLGGYYDEVEYRLRLLANTGEYSATNVIRQVMFSAIRVKK
jgi:hypothetical protein